MSDKRIEPGHGDSLASWVAVSIIMVGTAIATLAFWFDQALVVWISAAFAFMGIPAGMLLKRLGYGVGGLKSKKSGKNDH